jgi:hypothetical protein
MKKLLRTLILCLTAAALSAGAICPAAAEAEDPEGQAVIDLDLSRMSGTIVYSQVYNMLYDPEPWLGRIIRMAGYYNYYDDQEHGTVYHACIIPDATACCVQGIEFVLAGEHTWPEDYPEIGADILVTGRLEEYEESGVIYLHLVDAEMTVEKQEE